MRSARNKTDQENYGLFIFERYVFYFFNLYSYYYRFYKYIFTAQPATISSFLTE